jgi:hypothetical protein
MNEEAYVIMARRSNGMPKIVKAINDKLFYTLEDAKEYLKDYDSNIFGIFLVNVEVIKEE